MNIQQVFCDKLNEIISTNYSLYLLRIFVSVKNKSWSMLEIMFFTIIISDVVQLSIAIISILYLIFYLYTDLQIS